MQLNGFSGPNLGASPSLLLSVVLNYLILITIHKVYLTFNLSLFNDLCFFQKGTIDLGYYERASLHRKSVRMLSYGSPVDSLRIQGNTLTFQLLMVAEAAACCQRKLQ